ncbi:rap guanine nucleotide exchange factor 6 [Hydra vulgaris]|nr:rap guanine nucleotide exchange factor 6 [Hydra vulgaris]
MELDLATQFRQVLLIPKDRRSNAHIDMIYTQLREIQVVSQLPESVIRLMALHSRYEVHESNEQLYCEGDVAHCWYILLSGSVFIERIDKMYLPGESFGQKTKSGRRDADCFILEQSEMIVIDYHIEDQTLNRRSRPMSFDPTMEYYRDDRGSSADMQQLKEVFNKSEHQTSTNKPANQWISSSVENLDDSDFDLSGIKESNDVNMDSDDEILPNESAAVRDIVRDCLEKEPGERTENDINILMDFMQRLPAFNKLTHNIKVEMCKVMVFAVVDEAGAIVMSDGEEMDSWSVILNGSVEILYEDQPPKTLHLGDSFGVKTTQEQMFHKGVMKTRVDDCQFVCIAQNEYWRIFSHGEASCRKVEEEGEVVMVTEHRVQDGGSRQGQVVIKGTPERLLDHLMEDHSVIDPTYVEDFLLTYVVFFNKSHDIASKLLKWFERPQLKDKVTRVMLLWVNNHFSDFEGDVFMESCLERFEYLLEAKKMLGQLRLLNMACSAKSKPRIINLQRLSKETHLDFSICGGREKGFPIFVSKVNYDSKAAELGLKRGDQIIEVNAQALDQFSCSKAIDFLMSNAHLCLTVKTNTIGFKEVIQPTAKKTQSSHGSLDETVLSQQIGALDLRVSNNKLGTSTISRSSSDVNNVKGNKKAKNFSDMTDSLASISGSSTLPKNSKLKRAMLKFSFMPRSPSERELNKLDYQDSTQPFTRSFTKPSQDSHNQTNADDNHSTDDEYEDTVIKVYRSDHTSKFFILRKDTIAKQVVISALEAFGITDYASKSYFLCEVTVTEDGLIKQKRLPEKTSNLASRISLNSRYYIKASISEGPISDEVAQEIAREANFNLLQLTPLDVAKELTLQDFDLFRNVDSREYIYNLFESNNERKSKNLRCVEQTTNTEMFWVISEICLESNIAKRVKLLKYYIKVAKYCKDFKNYNSMYAVISGLANTAISRLKHTWEKLPQKHEDMFQDLLDLMDPSRNMSKYRNMFTGEQCYPPIIPWFPIVKKDMTFLHLGNDTHVDGLVNFEKLRMIAREVRRVCKFCAIGYDPYKMETLQDNPGENNVALSVVSIMTGAPNRRSGRGFVKDPKKTYEEIQTSRKIRQYLEKLSSRHYTEKELIEMSYNCEPPLTLTAPGVSQRSRSKPPPLTNSNKSAEDKSESSRTNSVSSLESTVTSNQPPRRKLPTPTSSTTSAETSSLPDSSSSILSRNGSWRSASSGSRNFRPPYSFTANEDQVDSVLYDNENVQISMV